MYRAECIGEDDDGLALTSTESGAVRCVNVIQFPFSPVVVGSVPVYCTGARQVTRGSVPRQTLYTSAPGGNSVAVAVVSALLGGSNVKNSDHPASVQCSY